MTTTNEIKLHVFEKAGLGKAPFRCVGFFKSVFQAIPGDANCPIQPGSSCDFCGNAIMNVFQIKSADGNVFKVGCDCVARAGDAGLKRVVNAKKAEHEKELRTARSLKKIEANKAVAETVHAELLARLAKLEAFGGFHARFSKDIARQIRAGLLAKPSTRQMELIEKLVAEKGV